MNTCSKGVRTSASYLQALSQQDFELLIIDEAHHSTANVSCFVSLSRLLGCSFGRPVGAASH